MPGQYLVIHLLSKVYFSRQPQSLHLCQGVGKGTKPNYSSVSKIRCNIDDIRATAPFFLFKKKKSRQRLIVACTMHVVRLSRPFCSKKKEKKKKNSRQRLIVACTMHVVCISRPYHFKFFRGCLPQIFLGPFLNTLTQIYFSRVWKPTKFRQVIYLANVE